MKIIFTKDDRWSKMAFIVWMLLVSSIPLFQSCEKEEVSTEPLLQSFGPSPALRGGELRFIGQNLDKVTAVIFQGLTSGTVQVSEIIVVNEREIKVVIPQDAGVGLVKLITSSGELTTMTPITYSEPIEIDKVSPLKVKASETLTIQGDYLNLIQKVIFFDGVVVETEDFVKQTRKELQVKVPAEAQTGKIIISNGEEIPIEVYSDSDIEIVLPSVSSPIDLTNKKPGDVIEVTGKDFDLVKTLIMPNGDEVPFEVVESDDSELIRFTLPENMTDGIVTVRPASGVDVAIGTIGLAIPENVVAVPENDLRENDQITLKGENMDLVTFISFPGVDEPVEPKTKTSTELTVMVPESTISGNILLHTGSGVSIEVPIETLKPVFASYKNNAVPLGGQVVINGENLDLVSKVLFNGGGEVEISNSIPNILSVTMPTMNVETGPLVLFMSNGESVEIPSLTIEAPQFAFIPILPGEDVEIKAGELFGVEVANIEKLTAVHVNDSEVKFIEVGDKIYISMPQTAIMDTKLTLISSNGKIDYTLNVLPLGQIENVIYEGPVSLTWGEHTLAPDAFAEFTNGTVTLRIDYAVTGDGDAQIKFYNGHWENILTRLNEGEEIYTFDPNSNVLEIELTGEELNMLQTINDWGYSMVFHGQNVIINKIVAVYRQSFETTVWTGPLTITWDFGGRVVIPASTFSNVRAGSKMRFYFDQITDVWGQAQIRDGSWDPLVFEEIGSDTLVPTDVFGWEFDSRVLEVILTREILDQIAAKEAPSDSDYPNAGLLIQGSDIIFTKVTIE